MTVRSVRLPTNLWNALAAGLEQANLGRKRPILLSDLIRGLLEHGLADPCLLTEVGTQRTRPRHLSEAAANKPPIEDSPTAQVAAPVELQIGSAVTEILTVAERLHRARISSNLPAGKIVDHICRLQTIPADILKVTRKQLYDNAMGDPTAEQLSSIATELAGKWLDTIETVSGAGA